MDNKENVVQCLEAFAKNPADKIPPMLECYLLSVAKSGETLFPWSKVKPLVISKLETEIKMFSDKVIEDEYEHIPESDALLCKEMQTRILLTLNSFRSAPFTIQRIIELVLYPFKHYRKMNKWLRGIEKNVNVVSSVDPFGNKIVSEPKEVMNGIDHAAANVFDAENKRTPVIQSPFAPPGPPPSAQASPGISLPWRESSPWPSSPLVWGTNDSSPLSDYQSNIVSSNIVSPLGICDDNESEEDEPSSEPLQKRLKFDDAKENEHSLNCNESQACLSPSNSNAEWKNSSQVESMNLHVSGVSDQYNIHTTSNDVLSSTQCSSNINEQNSSQVEMQTLQDSPQFEPKEAYIMEIEDTCAEPSSMDNSSNESLPTESMEENVSCTDDVSSSQFLHASSEISSDEGLSKSCDIVSSSVSEDCESNISEDSTNATNSVNKIENTAEMKIDELVSSSNSYDNSPCNINLVDSQENYLESNQVNKETAEEKIICEEIDISSKICAEEKTDDENYELSSL